MMLENKTLGKYRIIKRIGSGGFGMVYLALDTWIQRKVAIKIPHKQEESLENLLQEARIQASLPHPNIVEIYSTEKKENTFFIVSEFVDGPPLDKVIKKEKGLPWEKAVSIIFQVCDAVQFAHDNKVLHRDIRPANILLTGNYQVKMTDFGTSRYLNPDSIAITRVGCPPYMAPEHFEGKATYQSDVYSIGMMLYEMVTGELPFTSFNPIKIEEEVRNRLFTSPEVKSHNLGKDKSNLIMKALEKSLHERFKSPSDLKKSIITLEESQISQNPDGYIPFSRTTPRKAEEIKSSGKTLCWNCGKLLSPRAKVCPSCYQEQ